MSLPLNEGVVHVARNVVAVTDAAAGFVGAEGGSGGSGVNLKGGREHGE